MIQALFFHHWHAVLMLAVAVPVALSALKALAPPRRRRYYR